MDEKVRVETCDAKHSGLEKRIEDLDMDFKTLSKAIADDFKRLYDKIEAFATRPSWVVLWIISLLTSVSVGLMVKILTS